MQVVRFYLIYVLLCGWLVGWFVRSFEPETKIVRWTYFLLENT